MKKLRRIAAIVATAFVLAGCAGEQGEQAIGPGDLSDVIVRITYDPVAEFPSSGTYAFAHPLPEDEQLPADVIVRENWIRMAIEKELKRKGNVISDAQNVEFLVSYSLIFERDAHILGVWEHPEDEDMVDVFGYVDDFVRESFTMEVIDFRTMKLVWRGHCNANMSVEKPSDEEMERRVKYAVQELLRTFPPE
ncbi:MAG: DUF4136 domain-containing protein [Planctomycetota bacterium]|jgi:hypothetical protein